MLTLDHPMARSPISNLSTICKIDVTFLPEMRY